MPIHFLSSYCSDDLEEAHDYELLKKDEPSTSAEAENDKDASSKI